jgi:hypothetical protein
MRFEPLPVIPDKADNRHVATQHLGIAPQRVNKNCAAQHNVVTARISRWRCLAKKGEKACASTQDRVGFPTSCVLAFGTIKDSTKRDHLRALEPSGKDLHHGIPHPGPARSRPDAPGRDG